MGIPSYGEFSWVKLKDIDEDHCMYIYSKQYEKS